MKLQGTHANWFIVEQLPIVPPAAYDRRIGGRTMREMVTEAAFELTYTAHDLAPLARAMNYVAADGSARPPFRWNAERRLAFRCKLDALYFLLYGIADPARPDRGLPDVAYIFSTFPIVERNERAAWGRYRSRDLTIAWLNALLAGNPDATVTG